MKWQGIRVQCVPKTASEIPSLARAVDKKWSLADGSNVRPSNADNTSHAREGSRFLVGNRIDQLSVTNDEEDIQTED